jgi:hypothetical protein
MAFKYDPKLATEPFPPGRYLASLEGVAQSVSRRGLPTLLLDFDVVDGKRRRKIQGWITNPTNLIMLKELAIAFGEGNAFEVGSFDLALFVGRQLTIDLRLVETEMHGAQNVITHYLPATYPPVKYGPPKQRLEQRWSQEIQKEHDPSQREKADKDDIPSEDDIPF